MAASKRVFVSLLLLGVLAVAFVVADQHGDHDHSHDETSDVVTLDFSTFGDFIKNNDYVFVEFYAPWCGHCRNLAPTWEQLATTLKNEGSEIKIAKVDAAQDTLLAQEYDIQGFPTLKLFKKGTPVDYEGGRDLASLKAWAVRKTAPALQKIETEEKLKAFTHGLVGYFPDSSSAARKVFSDAANEIEFDGWSFAEVSDAALAKTLGLAENEVKLIQEGKEDKSLTVQDSTATDAVKSFICHNGYTVGEEISQAVYQRLEKCGRPFIIYFYSEKAQAEDFVKNVAPRFAGKISFSIADGTKWKDVLVRMGGSGNFLPSFVAFAKTQKGTDRVIAWNEETPITTESIDSWFNGVVDGTAKGFLKSEPIPDNTNNKVIVLVGKTFEATVFDETKDVLVEYYAPWCPHCKAIESTYNQLGETIAAATPSVIIAKIDATANSIPDDISVAGFPTIHFFPAGDKANPINYEGDRSLRDLVSFVHSHATQKFEIDLSSIPETESEEPEYEEEEEDHGEEEEEDEEDEEDEEEEEEEEHEGHVHDEL